MSRTADAKCLREVLKRGVASSVTVGVVDLLQPVEVDHRNSDVETGSVGAGDSALQILSQCAAIGAAGERVDECRLAQARGHAFDGF